MANAQMTIRGAVGHVQVGETNNYAKFDIPATDEVRSYFDAQMKAGNFGRSFANTDTPYVPVLAEKITTPSWKVRGVEIVVKSAGKDLN